MWQGLQPREIILLITLGVFIILFILFYSLLFPQYIVFSGNRELLSDLEARAVSAENILASERKESELAAGVNAMLAEVTPFFDDQMDDGLVVAFVGYEATQANVRIDSFKPENIVNKGLYLELPFKFEVSGNYTNVISLLKSIESTGMPNLTDLRTLKIEPEKGTASEYESANNAPLQGTLSNIQNGRVTATFDLVIYASSNPEGRLKLEQETICPLGRQNPFQTPDRELTSPDHVQETVTPVLDGMNPLNTLVRQTHTN